MLRRHPGRRLELLGLRHDGSNRGRMGCVVNVESFDGLERKYFESLELLVEHLKIIVHFSGQIRRESLGECDNIVSR